jgi:hypothetical protein
MSGHAHLRTTAMVAAGAYGAGAVLELVRDQPATFSSPLDYLIEASFVGGLAATVTVLVGLARRQRSVGPRLALGLAGAGNAVILVAAGGTLVLGREVLDGVFVLGVLGVIVGFLGLAVLDLFRRLAPRRAGVVLLLGFVGSMVVSGVLGAALGHGGDGGTAGGLALAAAWVAVGRLLSPEPSVAAEQMAAAHA